MRAGQLNKLIDIEVRSTTQDAAGQPQDVWTPFKSGTYARMRPLSGRELVAAQAVQNEVTHEITIRYADGVLPNMRVKYGARYFNILAVRDIEEGHRAMVLTCAEGLSDG